MRKAEMTLLGSIVLAVLSALGGAILEKEQRITITIGYDSNTTIIKKVENE